MADGTKYELPSIELPPARALSIDLGEALRNAPPSIQSHMSEYGSVAVRYDWHWPGAICATVWNLDAPRSLTYTYFLMPFGEPERPRKTNSGNVSAPASSQAGQQQYIEGLWWKNDPDVHGFVTLANSTGRVINAKLVMLGDHNSLDEQEFRIAPHATELVQLEGVSAQFRRSQQGGIEIRYKGAVGDLVVTGGMENDGEGYSAHIPFWPRPESPATGDFTHAGVGLMVGAQDPMMMFPEGTRFTPYVVARNTSSKPLTVSLRFTWMENSTPRQSTLPAFVLQAAETRQLPMQELLNAAGLASLNGTLNLAFTFSGSDNDLLLATGSIDQTFTYVFDVVPQGIHGSESHAISYWKVADGTDTMVSLWNYGNKDRDLVFTLFYTGGQYEHPIHLAAGASAMFDISELIMMQQPDSHGNVLPIALEEGSAKLSSAAGETEATDTAMDVGIYNPHTATCGYTCKTCNGYTDYWIIDDPFWVFVYGNHQLSAIAQYSTGTQYNRTSSSAWNSTNTQVGTVSTGLVSGLSPGSLWIDANYFAQIYGTYCTGYGENPCVADNLAASSPGTVKVPTTLHVVNVTVLPDGSGPPYGCGGSVNYGIMVDIKYQVLDQQDQPIHSSNMTPHETGTLFGGSQYDNDIGPVNGYPTSSKNTAADGTFHDVPVGVCSSLPISDPGLTSTQNITIIMPDGRSYAVRSQSFTVTAPGSASFGHGHITNVVFSLEIGPI